ncbi:hypothetical protein D3C80_2017120 [compost metagenome]
MEFQAEPTAWPLAHAQLAEPVVHRFQLGTVETCEVWIDARFATEVEHPPVAPQAQRAG